VLLRTYGGLFEDEIKIDEFFLAKKASITSTQVIKNLKILEEQYLVEYTPVNAAISLTFLLPREDDKTINRFSKELKQFLFLKKEKAINFINFVTNNKVCRSIQLLSYFDEEKATTCGICDVCIGNKKVDRKHLALEIVALLEERVQLSSKEISHLLKVHEKDILIHLHTLLSEDKLTINNQNKFQLKI
jgi:ATP-dependent DNA helicase RecQ